MSWISQTDRFLQLTTPLDDLIIVEFTGEEEISQPFSFTLRMVSANTDISPDKLLNQKICVELHVSPDDGPRYFHGYVTNFHAGEVKEGSRYYEVIVKPWLALLDYASDCRIFQNQSVEDIAKKIFSEFNFNDYDTSGLTKNYPARDYCVQYQETTLSFLNRIFQEEGIFYFFTHAENKHILVLADKNTAFKPLDKPSVTYTKGTDKDQAVTSWNKLYNFYSGKYTQKDYNFETPSTNLESKQDSSAKLKPAQKYELYQYPGNYQTAADGKNLAQQKFETAEIYYNTIAGQGNYEDFSCGRSFTLANGPNESDDGDYIITSVIHHAHDGSYLQGNGGAQVYVNRFTCIPSTVPYHSLPTAIKPAILSAQTAIVVGPAGEELYTDKYGRVKVQFHWDRKGKKDDYSSCFVRVAQSIAGNQWGTLFMPRIGQEVIVQFLEGDPDRPIITGSVYNANNLPPYQLPFEQTRSGIITRSTKGGSAGNELRFEDKLGNEELYLFAQKDLTRTVTNNETVTILQGDQTTQIQAGKSSLQAAKSIELTVDNNTLLINASGIYINGEEVNINS